MSFPIQPATNTTTTRTYACYIEEIMKLYCPYISPKIIFPYCYSCKKYQCEISDIFDINYDCQIILVLRAERKMNIQMLTSCWITLFVFEIYFRQISLSTDWGSILSFPCPSEWQPRTTALSWSCHGPLGSPCDFWALREYDEYTNFFL